MEELIIKALEVAGYATEHASVSSLMDCFKDYVADGHFGNLDLVDGEVFDEFGEKVTDWKVVAKNLIRICR